ncbi:MAG: GTP pyrophosphokinase family protein [Clostridia bacterium]|nr:GTP pyrophosphokinase family protein [Clostridia bacterium]
MLESPRSPIDPQKAQAFFEQFFSMQIRYKSAIREMQTKLEILDDEFQMRHQRNPIHHMQSRIKAIPSIVQKLERKGLTPSVTNAVEHLSDIAGVRVICSYLEDIYTIADLLRNQDDLTVLHERDYIKDPKPNGYRSLHLIISVPVFLSEGKYFVPVEVQIRTIAMDFWASLEHHIHYKKNQQIPGELAQALAQAAEDIAHLDRKMQAIYGIVEKLEE